QATVSEKKRRSSETATSGVSYDTALYNALNYRSIGPFRGGRSCAVTGIEGQPNIYFMGTTGGGIWKSIDGGQSWKNISDGYFGGSIGAIATGTQNKNILYVGTGENTLRGNVSPGYGGMFKSYDGGKTWESIGLEKGMHVGRIRVHPDNDDVVFVSVIGNIFKNSPDRGVYKTVDGGKTWKKVLYMSDKAGAMDLVFEPGNPRVLYASTWNVNRSPYGFSSGGEGSGLHKSTDGGDTWINISGRKGLPEGPLGIIGVAVSPVNPDRVWAQVEAKDGGLFRSDDAGQTWKKINTDRSLRQRAWYYTRVYADPVNVDRVYVLNVRFWRSDDGGKNFKSIGTPHGDHHDLWIAPENNSRMIVGDDGGGQVTFDGGVNWSTYQNQPTAQFYRVTTDNSFPYKIYAAQQDNSTVRISHRTDGSFITDRDWEPTAGGESAHIAVDPIDNDKVYGGSYGGYLTQVNHASDQIRVINVWPDNPMGHGAEDMKYRFQWNFPIFFSPNDNKKLYTTSNHFHASTDEGQSWKIISPDLTRAEPEKLGSSGGPITQDNTAVEYYATIFAACESPYEAGLLWAGSDDGLLHVSRDGGNNWDNVTPPQAPKYLMYNSVEPDPFTKGGLYVAGTLYKGGDFRPYLYKTEDYGKTWKQITNGIANDHFTRVLRADPERKGLLYAGTENGMYISFDDGASWNPFQLNLPQVPITDLAVKQNNLVVATQGRSLWVIDDLTLLHQLQNGLSNNSAHLFKPMDGYRFGRAGERTSLKSGQNHHNGIKLYYYLKDAPAKKDTISISFADASGKVIRTYSNVDKENMLTAKKGSNSFLWNMRYPDAEGFDGLIMWSGGLTGPKAVPGTYFATLTVNGQSQKVDFEILKDPRSTATLADIQAQFDFLISVRDKLTETHQTIKEIREVRKQMISFKSRVLENKNLEDLASRVDSINRRMTEVEEALYQTKNRSRQDPLNFPIKLNDKLSGLNSVSGRGEWKPTDQSNAVKNELIRQINEELKKWNEIKTDEIPNLNKAIREKQVDFINVKKKSKVT
ncbi:MAG: glycosyl hydrolase, partial [Bacteroidota bacterium]